VRPADKTAFAFAIIELFAPNEERSERTDDTCELVRPDDVKPMVDTAPPVKIIFMFVIAALLAPNEERIDCTD
jgi:hypothetical protein